MGVKNIHPLNSVHNKKNNLVTNNSFHMFVSVGSNFRSIPRFAGVM